MKNNPYKKGFIALVSAVIISILLLGVTLTMSLTGFFGRFNILDSESKERSLALAEGCVDIAVLDYIENGSITTGDGFVVGDDECDILPATDDSSDPITVITHGEFNKAHTYIEAVVDTSDGTIESWQEWCTALSPCP